MNNETEGARLLTGKPVADAIRADITTRTETLAARGVTPRLQLLRVGDRPDDVHYEKSIIRQSEKLGLCTEVTELQADVTQHDLEAAMKAANENAGIHGIMIFQPLPKHLNASRLAAIIDPSKDVDGMSPVNQAKVYGGDPTGYPPCTPQAVVELLKHYEVPLSGTRVSLIGRSLVVGKPAAMLLMGENATVTVCHSRTKDLSSVTKEGDVLVAAMGKMKFVTAEYVRRGQIVVDVGIHEDEEGNLIGDVDQEGVAAVVDALTPARGGVGSITTALLLRHVLESAERHANA